MLSSILCRRHGTSLRRAPMRTSSGALLAGCATFGRGAVVGRRSQNLMLSRKSDATLLQMAA